MKKILVISAYPKGNNSLGETLIGGLNDNMEIVNLYDYEISFYRGGQKLSKEMELIVKKMKKYDNWLFIFPVWWSNMPGILKNFFDWAILYGLIYDAKSVPQAALEDQNKNAMVICTSGDVYDDAKEDVLKLIAEEILPYWGVDVVGKLFIEDTYNLTEEKFSQNKEKICSLLSKFA